jgi:hypothetical protein
LSPDKNPLLFNEKGFLFSTNPFLPDEEGFLFNKKGFLLFENPFSVLKQGFVLNEKGFLPGKQGFVSVVNGFLQPEFSWKQPSMTKIRDCFPFIRRLQNTIADNRWHERC